MFLTFISKFDNMENRLTSAINKALKIVGIKQAIRFEERGIIYTIPLDDILYITTSTIDRKTVLVTGYNEYKCSKSLNEVSEMLNGNFKQSHRSCLINLNRVSKIDKKNNIIEFDSGIKTDLLSDSFKKVIV